MAAPVAFGTKTFAESKRTTTPIRSVHLDSDNLRAMAEVLDTSEDEHAETPVATSPITGIDWDMTIPDFDLKPPLSMDFAGDEFLVSHDLRVAAEEMIEEFPELNHVKNYRVVYLWKAKGGTKGEKHRLGNCERVSGMKGFFAKADFIIWLARDHAITLDMTSRQLEALLYHELCHVSFEVKDNGEEVTKVAQHDVELFYDEIRRYGLWTTDLETAQETFRQARIPFGSISAGTAA